MERVTYALVARVPREGVTAFEAYERVVLPLLGEHGGRLDRRVRSVDGALEIHLLEFDSPQALERFRADPRRIAAQPLLEEAAPELELIEVVSVPTPESG